MRALEIAFALAVNAAVSLWVAWALVLLVIRLGRVGPGRLRVALLALPPLKVVVSLVRFVPDEAFLWAYLDGASRSAGELMVGLGLSPWRAHLLVVFRAVVGETSYPASIGDLSADLLTRLHRGLVPLLAAAAILVAAVRLARRFDAALALARWRRLASQTASALPSRRAAGRLVQILVTDEPADGAAFTGGLLRPFICLPRRSWDRLDAEERHAVLGHELAHVRWADATLLALVRAVTDLLWFVPGSGRLARQLAVAVELAADDGALAGGARPLKLASALLRSISPAPAAAIGAAGGALQQRVRRLLNPQPSRPSWGARAARLALAAVAANTILLSVLGSY